MHNKQINELWETTHEWLSAIGIKINRKYCREEITLHPDYPSILSVTDLLDTGNMQYDAIKTTKHYSKQLRYPLLAHIKLLGHEYFSIVNNSNELENNEEIIKGWSGVIIAPGLQAKWNNPNNESYRNNYKNYIFILFSFTTLFGLSYLNSLSFSHPLYINIFALFSLLGLALSLISTSIELGYQSNIAKQICGIGAKSGCERVLTSQFSKGIGGVTPGLMSLTYFTVQYILYIISPYNTALLSLLFLISLLGIPIIIWSLYVQGIVLKKWCKICLGIISVLFIQAAFGVRWLNFNFGLQEGIIFILLFSILLSIISAIEGVIKSNNSLKQKLIELKKWKLDVAYFIDQWEKEESIDDPNWNDDLQLGNPNAPISITIVCQPFCNPCKKEHEIIDELLSKHSYAIKVKMRFLCNTESNNERSIASVTAAEAIIRKSKQIRSNEELIQMLSDWFHWMNYKIWFSKWGAVENIDTRAVINQHTQWCKENNIRYTPTSFINGKKVPSKYKLKDIDALIPQLVEYFGGGQR